MQGETRWSAPPRFVMPHSSLLISLADALLAGDPAPESLFERCTSILGKRWRWLRPLTARYLANFGPVLRPRHRDVITFLQGDKPFQRALAKYSDELLGTVHLTPPQMRPAPGQQNWGLPVIETPGDLAAWLGLDIGELRWFADLKGLLFKKDRPPLDHYHYRIQTKRFGSVRLIEAPKPRLKDRQRQILLWILDKVPAHPAVHGFVKGRSIRTFVAPHIGQSVLLRIDLRDFFPTFGGVRIQNLFRTLGYPEAVGDLLGGICTNATPVRAWNEVERKLGPVPSGELRRMYSRPHLPQGAPTSPTLSNISFYRVDCRLSGLAKSVGATYTRYADDLAFSGGGEFERCAERFARHVAAILQEEGFRVHHRKTRIMRHGVKQHLAGLTTNTKMNIDRRNFDQLKAVLTNCARLGPEGQNRGNRRNFRAHLEGRVSFVEMVNPTKARRLRAILNQIQWES